MRVFIIDTANLGPELRGGLIGVVGSAQPTAEEKAGCVDAVSRYVAEGWGIAADPHTIIGRLAALAAEAGCVPFVSLRRLRDEGPMDVDTSVQSRLESGIGQPEREL